MGRRLWGGCFARSDDQEGRGMGAVILVKWELGAGNSELIRLWQPKNVITLEVMMMPILAFSER